MYRNGLGFGALQIIKRVKKFQSLASRYVTKLEAFATHSIADSLQNIIRPKEEDEQHNVFTHGDLWVIIYYFTTEILKVVFQKLQTRRALWIFNSIDMAH